MSCKYSRGKHDWVKLLEIPDTDYTPGQQAWWCEGCGIVMTRGVFDNRIFDIVEYHPSILKCLNTEDQQT